VLIEFAKICVKFQTKQKEFLHSLKSLYTTNSIREILAPGNDDFDRYGCQLLSSLFDFENITILVNQFFFLNFNKKSLKELESEFVTNLCFHKNGSLLVEKFIEKRPKIIFEKISQPEEISCDIYGSRVIQKLFKSDEILLKLKLGTVLSNFETSFFFIFLTFLVLCANKFGKIVFENCQISTFKTVSSRKEWRNNEERNLKLKQNFSSIIEEEKPKKEEKLEKKEKSKEDKLKQSKEEKSKEEKKEEKSKKEKVKKEKSEKKKEEKSEKKKKRESSSTTEEEEEEPKKKKKKENSTGEDLSFVFDAIKKAGNEKQKKRK
jgi:hypothetical protein